MGFNKTIVFRGITVVDAYHRIDTTTSADGQCTATLNNYISRESFLNGDSYLEQTTVSYPIEYGSGKGSDKDQGYSYLATTEEYSEVQNVFEEGQPY